jgi:uncharacterized protein
VAALFSWGSDWKIRSVFQSVQTFHRPIYLLGYQLMDQDPNVLPSAASAQPPPPALGSERASTPPPPPPQATQQAPQASYHTSGISSDERMWAMLGHLSSLAGYLTGGIGCIVGPLIIWQVKKDVQPFAAAQAKEALNFNLSLLIYGIGLFILGFILLAIGIGVLLILAIWALPIIHLVLTIIAGIKANEGVPYRYPLTIRIFN